MHDISLEDLLARAQALMKDETAVEVPVITAAQPARIAQPYPTSRGTVYGEGSPFVHVVISATKPVIWSEIVPGMTLGRRKWKRADVAVGRLCHSLTSYFD